MPTYYINAGNKFMGEVVPIVENFTRSVPASDMKGQTHLVYGGMDLSLPQAQPGMSALFRVMVTGVLNIRPFTGDLLSIAGTTQNVGDKISSDGVIYSAVYMECNLLGRWEVYPHSGFLPTGA